MGDRTTIHWTQKTWNPWQGCIKVSPGCKHCYMYRDMTRYGKDPRNVRRSSDATFNAPRKWHDPAMVFTCSWSDFFIEEADGWRNDAYDVMWDTQHLTYQVLTKRPERIAECLPVDWYDTENWRGWRHLWLGTSVETQEYAVRLDYLLRVEAAVRFLSAEPLLGPLDLREYLEQRDMRGGLEWVIVGGESGPDCRPMDLDWARRIRDDCAEYGVPFFFKQVGGNRKINGVWGGDLLDGVQHYNWPTPKPFDID